MSDKISKEINAMMDDGFIKDVPYKLTSELIMEKYSKLEIHNYLTWRAQNPDTDEYVQEMERMRDANRAANPEQGIFDA